jgi:nitronate monooxygenase
LPPDSTNPLINANFFMWDTKRCNDEQAKKATADIRNRIADKLNIDLGQPAKPPYFSALDDQLKPIWRHHKLISMLTFHFGVPPAHVLKRARDLNIVVGATATSVEEARVVAGLAGASAVGCDFIVAQGYEAGGHRGTFDIDGTGDERLPTVELVKRIVADQKQRPMPVVAAGGIMTVDHIREAQSAGAVAMQACV